MTSPRTDLHNDLKSELRRALIDFLHIAEDSDGWPDLTSMLSDLRIREYACEEWLNERTIQMLKTVRLNAGGLY